MIGAKKISIPALAIIIACMFVSCNKDDSGTWLYYEETGCADDWDTNDNDSEEEVAKAVAVYLLDRWISVFEIEVLRRNDGEGCEACHCKSGRHIRALAKQRDISELEDLGFKRE